ncbi:3-phosphoshikimate 1-carboxyvinyltransferase [Bacteroidia bacterium]|nr:3-phosphoshikimate 1-carboxyvinyltransferase [Bacteroidia bacterium]
MIYKIKAPLSINAAIRLPASKSISNRVLVLNRLANTNYQLPVSDCALPVSNLSDSDDTLVLQRALMSSGRDFDVGAAGTSMRFLTAFLAQQAGEWTITGSERMKKRPIKLLVEALRALGAEISYLAQEGFPPLKIAGHTLRGGQITMKGDVSSQYISALMMIAPHLENGLELTLEGEIISMPYLWMTIRLMEEFGVSVNWSGQTITIRPQTYKPVPFTVESDWSAASYWYEIAALAPQSTYIDLPELKPSSIQGDAKVQSLFEQLGVETEPCHCGLDPQSPDSQSQSTEGLRIKTAKPSATTMKYDFTNEPDLAQTLVVTCCLLGISFSFTGLQSLRIKETDRIAALQTELHKLGYVVGTSNSAMYWSGERCKPDKNPVIATYDDHRMAMAFAPACLAGEPIRIADPQVVTKSYPKYWDDLKQAGFTIENC